MPKYWKDDDGTELYRYGDENFRKDFQFQSPFGHIVSEILIEKLDVKSATEADIRTDRVTATDWICYDTFDNKLNVGCRIRRDCKWREMTVRAIRLDDEDHRLKTEIDKLAQGYVDYYIYLWTVNNKLVDYSVIDCYRMNKAGMFDLTTLQNKYHKELKWNGDEHTAFVTYGMNELYDIDAIVYSTISYTGNVNYNSNDTGWVGYK